jgi:hypothetical protein
MLPVNVLSKVLVSKFFMSIAVVSIGNPGSKQAPKKVVVIRQHFSHGASGRIRTLDLRVVS